MRSNWALLISGRGTNAQCLMDVLPEINVVWMVSSKRNAPGILRAQRRGVPVSILDSKIDWSKLNEELVSRRVNKIFLLGFMKILPESFLKAWQGRIWNVHPSLLPNFKGAHGIEDSYRAQSPMGVSIHEVIPELDSGKVIYQKGSWTKEQIQSGMELSQAQLGISRDEQHLVFKSAQRLDAHV